MRLDAPASSRLAILADGTVIVVSSSSASIVLHELDAADGRAQSFSVDAEESPSIEDVVPLDDGRLLLLGSAGTLPWMAVATRSPFAIVDRPVLEFASPPTSGSLNAGFRLSDGKLAIIGTLDHQIAQILITSLEPLVTSVRASSVYETVQHPCLLPDDRIIVPARGRTTTDNEVVLFATDAPPLEWPGLGSGDWMSAFVDATGTVYLAGQRGGLLSPAPWYINTVDPETGELFGETISGLIDDRSSAIVRAEADEWQRPIVAGYFESYPQWSGFVGRLNLANEELVWMETSDFPVLIGLEVAPSTSNVVALFAPQFGTPDVGTLDVGVWRP